MNKSEPGAVATGLPDEGAGFRVPGAGEAPDMRSVPPAVAGGRDAEKGRRGEGEHRDVLRFSAAAYQYLNWIQEQYSNALSKSLAPDALDECASELGGRIHAFCLKETSPADLAQLRDDVRRLENNLDVELQARLTAEGKVMQLAAEAATLRTQKTEMLQAIKVMRFVLVGIRNAVKGALDTGLPHTTFNGPNLLEECKAIPADEQIAEWEASTPLDGAAAGPAFVSGEAPHPPSIPPTGREDLPSGGIVELKERLAMFRSMMDTLYEDACGPFGSESDAKKQFAAIRGAITHLRIPPEGGTTNESTVAPDGEVRRTPLPPPEAAAAAQAWNQGARAVYAKASEGMPLHKSTADFDAGATETKSVPPPVGGGYVDHFICKRSSLIAPAAQSRCDITWIGPIEEDVPDDVPTDELNFDAGFTAGMQKAESDADLRVKELEEQLAFVTREKNNAVRSFNERYRGDASPARDNLYVVCALLAAKKKNRVFYVALNQYDANMTVCPECRVDDFTHVEGCETGMRIADLIDVNWRTELEGAITYGPPKGRNYKRGRKRIGPDTQHLKPNTPDFRGVSR